MNHTTRRDFLEKLGTLGAVGVSLALLPRWMPRLAFAQTPAQASGNTLVCVFLRGGIDGLNVVVPYGDGAHYYDPRPTLSLPEPGAEADAVLDLDGYFGLHPALSSLKELYDAGALAFVHATGLTSETRSHFDAQLFMEYGTPDDKTTGQGWLNRHLQATAARNGSPFRAIGMGAQVPTSLQGQFSPLALRSIADFHLSGREDQLQSLRQLLGQLYAIDAPSTVLENQAALAFSALEQLEALDVANYKPANSANYPNDDEEFGLALRQVAQLIKADVGLEVACIDLGGWDTHENQGAREGYFADLLAIYGRGLSAFYTDLGEHMRSVTVVTMSEFGRRVGENANAGTDHGHGNFMLLMGGGVQGGQVLTRWPTLAPEALRDGDLAITIDYRDVLAEVVRYRLGNDDLGFVFPQYTPNPLGLITSG